MRITLSLKPPARILTETVGILLLFDKILRNARSALNKGERYIEVLI